MGTNWTVGKKLYTGFGVLLALLLVAGGVSYWAANGMNNLFAEHAKGTAAKLDIALQMQVEAVNAKSALRRIQLAGYTREQKAFEAGKKEAAEVVATIEKHAETITPLIKTEAGKKAVTDAVKTAKEWSAVKDQVVALVDQGKPDDARALASAQANPLVDKFLEECGVLVKQQRDFLQAGIVETDATFDTTVWIIFALLIASVVVGAVIVMMVRQTTNALRETANSMREASEQVVAASSQVSTAAQSLSQGATEQAASLEESSASMEEMGSMTRQNAENAQEAARLMTEVDQQVADSNKMLGDMVTSMTAIKESSAKVSKIIKTIDEIAFQTNILALNAAVEAARAGEAGMGFAVVADEVRNLAQRAAQAARDTAGLIEESSASAQQGSQQVERVAQSIAQFTESVGKVKSIAEGVSTASQQQAQGVLQVSTAIQEMEKVTQTTAATAEESAAASEELNAQAELAMQQVQDLERMVGRAGEGQTSRRMTFRKPAAAPRQAAPAEKVVKLGKRAKSPEEEIPLGDTGTFGKF